MSILGSAFGRALSGAGEAATDIGKKYIDDELQKSRAQFLADLQYQNQVKFDQYQQSPDRQATIANNDANRERVVGAARNETALAGERARATDQPLQDALTNNEVNRTKATTKAAFDTTTELTKAKANDPEALAAEQKILLNDPRVKAQIEQSAAAAAASRASAASSGAQVQLVRQQLEDAKAKSADLATVRTLRDQLANTSDPAQRDAITNRIADITGGGDPTKWLNLAEKYSDNVTAAMKILADPMADPAQKEQAMKQIERNQAMSEQLARKGGVATPKEAEKKVDPALALSQAEAAIKAGADRSAVLARLQQWGVQIPDTLKGTPKQSQPAAQPVTAAPRVETDSTAAPAKPSGPMADMTDQQLRQIAASPRNPGFQEAQAELKRRTQARPDSRMSDPAFDPTLYSR